MTYSISDFTESVQRSQIGEKDIKHVHAAFGGSCCGSCGSEWSGGFLMELKDGRWLYLTGWCDYTGWGCQDGIEETYFDSRPKLESLKKDNEASDWDLDPTDLNRQIQGKINMGVDD